jgi:hypothetical protein
VLAARFRGTATGEIIQEGATREQCALLAARSARAPLRHLLRHGERLSPPWSFPRPDNSGLDQPIHSCFRVADPPTLAGARSGQPYVGPVARRGPDPANRLFLLVDWPYLQPGMLKRPPL